MMSLLISVELFTLVPYEIRSLYLYQSFTFLMVMLLFSRLFLKFAFKCQNLNGIRQCTVPVIDCTEVHKFLKPNPKKNMVYGTLCQS
jgi:hypothetical protein